MDAMLAILSVIIGLVFVLLLFSLLTSTVMEIIAAILSLRGKHLLETLQNMLGGTVNDFMKHPFFLQLSYAANGKNVLEPYRLPSWLSKGTFSSILYDLLATGGDEEIVQKINNLPDSDFKRLLLYLLRESDGTVQGFKARLEHWFEEVMERSTDWYKRATKWWLFGVGLVLAAIFNADTIQIYQSLSANSTLREEFVTMASDFVARTDSVAAFDPNKPLEQAQAEAKELATTYKNVIQSPLGLGWNEQEQGGKLPWWLIKIVGFILTGIAVTFGAPFWFEMLKKLVNIRSAGSGTSTTVSTPPPHSSQGSSQPLPGTDPENIGTRQGRPPRRGDSKAVG